MAKIARAVQKIFGSSAGVNQIAKFGSLAASAPVFTTDPTLIQSLGNYLTGWFGAVIGANSPAIEDMNAICYLYAYQLAYLMQAGIAEWDATTTYYTGSLVTQVGTGLVYRSLTDTNLNHAVTDTTNWAPQSGASPVTAFNPAVSSPYTVLAADQGKTFNINSANGASQFNLPAPVANFWFTIADIAGSSLTNGTTLHRNGSETIEGLAADYVLNGPFFYTKVYTDGTNWFLGK